MSARSHAARLWQVTSLVLAAVALGWLAWQWPSSPVVAVLGALAIAFTHAVPLGIENILVWIVGRDDPAPRPRAVQLLRAWWSETLHALHTFGWRQAWRWDAVPDDLRPGGTARPIVFVHGFFCNRGFWTPYMHAARARGIPFVAVNLEPIFGDIDDYGATIDAAVRRATEATGRAPLLVCHSMGGLAARAWLRSHDGAARVAHVVTIGTPHRGTWLARFSRAANARQMRLACEWLEELEKGLAGLPAQFFTCWYSNCDNIVFPATTATLPGADNRLVHGAAHVQLAFRPEVMEHTLARTVAL